MEEKILYSMESPFQQEINVKGYYFGKNEGKETNEESPLNERAFHGAVCGNAGRHDLRMVHRHCKHSSK